MNADARMTPARRRVLDEIRRHQARQGRPPTVRELQRACGYRSPRAVTHHLNALESLGRIERSPHSARGLRIVGDPDHAPLTPPLPIYGQIPAGFPDTSTAETPEETIPLDPVGAGLARSPGAFALRVRGDSMEGAGILHGDIVVAEPGDPRPGDVVVALIDGESTLKRLVRRDGTACLASENPRYPDLVPLAELSIQGIVTGLLRRF